MNIIDHIKKLMSYSEGTREQMSDLTNIWFSSIQPLINLSNQIESSALLALVQHYIQHQTFHLN